MTPEKTNLCHRLERGAAWAMRLVWLALATGLGTGFYFYIQEPMNEPACDASILTGFYLVWGLLGLKQVLLCVVGILTRRIQLSHLISEGLFTDPHEIQGWKAIAVSIFVMIMSLLLFVVPGFALGFSELVFFLR